MITQKEVDSYITSLDEVKSKIKQLEKENAELKISINRIKNETFECDTCLDVCFENEKLEKENALLKAKLTANRFIFRTTIRNEYLDKIEDLESKINPTVELLKNEMLERGKLTFQYQQDISKLHKEIDELEDKLASIKTLDPQEVEKILRDIDPARLGSACWRGEVDKASTAICNLALPKIDKDRIVKVLKRNAEQFINYSNSPIGEIHSSPIYYLHNIKFNKVADDIISALGGK